MSELGKSELAKAEKTGDFSQFSYVNIIGKHPEDIVIRYDDIVEIEGTVSDITEKYVLEQKLKESEELFRSITEQSLLGITILQDNILKYVNKKMADIFGFSVKERESIQAGDFLKYIHPDDRIFAAKQARKKQLGEIGTVSQYEFRGIRKNGDIIWLKIFSKTISYQGKPADFITMIDITENKTADQKLRHLKKLV